ncbi:hypothetical protein KRR40_17330 [Niabella defluvii]|nr:hypothetical protein KRR40_17330 [Niabella sp. I65]
MGHKSIDWNYLNRDNDGSLITNGLNTFTKEYWTPQNPTNEYARLDAQGPGGVASLVKFTTALLFVSKVYRWVIHCLKRGQVNIKCQM